ncbi:MAG: DRTGG domain-containing protein [bacterium]|jgi:predicted transcriptional regulator
MQLAQLISNPALNLSAQAGQDQLGREVQGAYASDLLSHVMARAKEGNLWITIQAHQNIVAVAALLNLSGIVIAGGIEPQDDTLRKAEEEGIPLLTTDLDTFEVAGKLYALGIGAEGDHVEVATS